MRIQLTSEYEKDRVSRSKRIWELKSTTSVVEAVRYARDNGWAEKKVQVRREGDTYYVEPFEKDCSCPQILKYKDFF